MAGRAFVPASPMSGKILTFASHAQNHHLGGLDEGRRGLAWLEVHFTSRACRDDRSDLLIAYRDFDLRHEAAYADSVDSADELIASAHAADHILPLFFRSAASLEKQLVHFALRDAVVASSGLDAADLPLVNPLFDGWKADPEL